MTPVEPVQPVAPWLGGKRHLAETVIARLRAVPHVTYVEPFIGMGGIFLRRPWRSKVEVVNDISTDVANLFRCLQRHFVPLCDMLRWQVTSRDEFDRLTRAAPDSLTDLERAVRFLYLQRVAFGGKVRGRSFGISVTTPARFDVAKLVPLLEAVHERLSGVVIERLSWRDCIEAYDRPETLFYLDPPYWGSEDDYGTGLFRRADFTALADRLAAIAGSFVLSINDVTAAREIFGRFRLEEVSTTYGINPSVAGEARAELLVLGGRAAEATRAFGGRAEPGQGALDDVLG